MPATEVASGATPNAAAPSRDAVVGSANTESAMNPFAWMVAAAPVIAVTHCGNVVPATVPPAVAPATSALRAAPSVARA